MDKTLDGKVAVVTGSGRGLGRAMVMRMAMAGSSVVVNDLGGESDGTGTDKSPSDVVVAEIKKAGGTAVPNYDNVATMKGAENIINTALENFGRIDILVNNAGITRHNNIVDMSETDWDAVLNVHLKGHFCCSKFAAISMVKQMSGRIINISSGAFIGKGGRCNYSAAKAGILGFSRALAEELAPHGITVNALLPMAATRLSKSAAKLGMKLDPGYARDQAPEVIAPLVEYLAGDDASQISGYSFAMRREGIIELYSEPGPHHSIFKNGTWEVEDIASAISTLLFQAGNNPT